MFHQLGIKNLFLTKYYCNHWMLRNLVTTSPKMTLANTNKVLNVSLVDKMLHHFQTYNFIKINDNKTIQFDFNTENLKDHIKQEWLLANMVYPDQPAFRFSSLECLEKLKSAFIGVKNLVNAVPFNLISENICDKNENENTLQMDTTNSIDLISHQFKSKTGTTLKNLTFCSPGDAVEIFYRKQQERKIWWKKFSAIPGRFHTSVVCNDEDKKSLTGEIQAEFPWGLETVEVVKYLPEICMSAENFFEVKSKRKKFTPQIVSCTTILEKITLTYLCDSYEGLIGETNKDLLRFNRKLAPFKVAFAGNGTSAEMNKNLEDLALLLAKKIRKLRISVLLLPDLCSTSIERQLTRNDALGIPFTILLNEKTLKDGLIAVRSRDTTLKEQSHVSSIVSYIDKIMNY